MGCAVLPFRVECRMPSEREEKNEYFIIMDKSVCAGA